MSNKLVSEYEYVDLRTHDAAAGTLSRRRSE